MRRRTKLLLTAMHHLGLAAECPHPQWRIKQIPSRVVDFGDARYRCHECWLSWSSGSTRDAGDYSWMDA